MQNAPPPAHTAPAAKSGPLAPPRGGTGRHHPVRPGRGTLRERHRLPTTGDGIFYLPRASDAQGEAALGHILSWLEPIVLPGVCIALTPRRPGCSAMLDDLAGLLARSRVDGRAWITSGTHVQGRRDRHRATLARSARPLVRSARVLVLDEGGPGSTDRLTACRALLLAGGAGEVALLALVRPA